MSLNNKGFSAYRGLDLEHVAFHLPHGLFELGGLPALSRRAGAYTRPFFGSS